MKKSACGQPSDYSCCQYNVQGVLKCKKGSCNPTQPVLPNQYPRQEEMVFEPFVGHKHDENKGEEPQGYEGQSSHAKF